MNLNETYSSTKGRNVRRKTFTLLTPATVDRDASNRGNTELLSQTGVGLPNGTINNHRLPTPTSESYLEASAEAHRNTFGSNNNTIMSRQRTGLLTGDIRSSEFPTYSKISDLQIPYCSLAPLHQRMEKNLKKIRRNNRGSIGRNDISAMSADLFDVFENSSLDSAASTEKTLEELRKTENDLLEERDKLKSKIVDLKNNGAEILKQLRKKAETLKNLRDSRLAENDQLKANVNLLKKEKSELAEKGTFDRIYCGIMTLYAEQILKVDENFRCTDKDFCKEFHQDPGKCLRIKTLSTTIHLSGPAEQNNT